MGEKNRRAMYRFDGSRLVMVDLGSDSREMTFDATGIPFSGRTAFAEAVAQAYEVGYSRGVAAPPVVERKV